MVGRGFSLVSVCGLVVCLLIVLVGFGGVVSSSEDQVDVDVVQTTSVVVQGEPADADVLITNDGNSSIEVDITFWLVGEIGDGENLEFDVDDVTLILLEDGEVRVMPHQFEKTFLIESNSTEHVEFKIYYHGVPTAEHLKIWLVGDLSANVVDDNGDDGDVNGESPVSPPGTPSPGSPVDPGDDVVLDPVELGLEMFNDNWGLSSVLVDGKPSLNLVFENENQVRFVLNGSGWDGEDLGVVVDGHGVGDTLYVEAEYVDGSHVAVLNLTAFELGEKIGSVFVGDLDVGVEGILDGEPAGYLSSVMLVENDLELSFEGDLHVGGEVVFTVKVDGEAVEGAVVSSGDFESITDGDGEAVVVFDEPGTYVVNAGMDNMVLDGELLVYNVGSVEVDVSEDRGLFGWILGFALVIGVLLLFLVLARRRKPVEG
ncbi:hypothetical protein AMET1_1370 [Methanonatronarchaeum thermophilum]|uniref:Uncharacterized protein n=1 Tax=Methanonatronarchaeum thermophilum TaxID=1927129 RepID=A0A1Y3GE33_9EURY|nr:DUF4198 domain-containing protein [Methanonatronarchaeum thermophilum]OUJ18454.1 hypothetical protein AMET1_1370 [Methanonatronarchaeum thermophilum]